MKHELFGTLKYRDAGACWVGRASLALFAAHGARDPEPPPTDEQAGQMLADMNQALDRMRGQIRERLGSSADAAFRELEQQIEYESFKDVERDPADEERARKRQARDAKRAEKLARGVFPIRIADPNRSGPTAEQEATFRHLIENETAVFEAVLFRVWESFRHAYDDEHWRTMTGLQPATSAADLRGRYGVTRIEVAREERDGFAHLVFEIDSEWQDEHGLLVVYSPDRAEAHGTSVDGLDELLGPDEPIEDDYMPTPRDELLEAVITGDDDRAKQLIAEGADLNDVQPDEMPPLCIAVEQMEVEDVRRLLAYGADPALPDSESNRTPLKIAKQTYRELGFGTGKKKGPLLDAMLILTKETVGRQFDEIKQRLEAIIRLLEETENR